MLIRQANEGENTRILAFYHHLIDGMQDSPYRPAWKKGVYPTLDNITPAI